MQPVCYSYDIAFFLLLWPFFTRGKLTFKKMIVLGEELIFAELFRCSWRNRVYKYIYNPY